MPPRTRTSAKKPTEAVGSAETSENINKNKSGSDDLSVLSLSSKFKGKKRDRSPSGSPVPTPAEASVYRSGGHLSPGDGNNEGDSPGPQRPSPTASDTQHPAARQCDSSQHSNFVAFQGDDLINNLNEVIATLKGEAAQEKDDLIKKHNEAIATIKSDFERVMKELGRFYHENPVSLSIDERFSDRIPSSQFVDVCVLLPGEVSGEGKVDIQPEYYTSEKIREMLKAEKLALSDDCGALWLAFAHCLPSSKDVRINDTVYNFRGALANSIGLCATNWESWGFLGEELVVSGHNSIKVNFKEVSWITCMERALECTALEEQGLLWRLLGTHLDQDSMVGFKMHNNDKRTCYAKAALLDPSSIEWDYLGNMLKDGPVTVSCVIGKDERGVPKKKTHTFDQQYCNKMKAQFQ